MKKFVIILLFLVGYYGFSQEKNLSNNAKTPKEIFSNDTNNSNRDAAPEEGTPGGDGLIELEPIDPDTGGGTTSSNSEVGATTGELSVSLTGGANYSIPLLVPPGINGVVPQISLNYNSQSGFGYAGYGWNISGISKITRVPSTLYHDGAIDPVDSDVLDRFALDGQRLLLKTGVYGVIGSTYETENFSNVKITYLQGTGANKYFKVEYPDGSVAQYGYVDGLTSSGLVEWPITKWENAQHLIISYEYHPSGFLNEYYFLIKSIKYGNDTIEGINKIEFIYKNTLNPDTYYSFGVERKRNKILSEIRILGNATPFRNYYLTHDTTSTGKERLVNIQEKTGDNSISLKPTVFTYNKNQSSFSQQISYSHRGAFLPSQYTTVGDFDGNGESEFFTGSAITSLNSDYSTTITDTNDLQNKINTPFKFLNNQNKLSNKHGVVSLSHEPGSVVPNITARMYSLNENTNLFELEYEKLIEIENEMYFGSEESYFFGQETWYNPNPLGQNARGGFCSDFNGDNLTDMVSYRIVGGILYTRFVDMDRRKTTNYFFDSGTFNVGVATLVTTVSPSYYSGTTRIFQGDYDGDGISDLYILRGAPYNKIEIYSLQNNQFVKRFETSYALPGDIWDVAKQGLSVGDFNGDGKTDILMVLEGKILYSKGYNFGSFVEELLPNNIVKPDKTKRMFYLTRDMNNDGKSDILRIEKIFEWRKNTGTFNWIKSGIIFNFYAKDNNGSWINTNYEKVLQDYIYHSVSDDSSDDNTFFPVTSNPIFIDTKFGDESKTVIGISGNSEKYQDDSSSILVTSYFNFNRHLDDQNLLKSVENGNGLKDQVVYSNLVHGNQTYEKANNFETYPYFNLLSGKYNKVVSELSQGFYGFTKKRLFKYYGAIFDLSGRGVSGFQSTMVTNWFNDNSQIVSTITKFDFSKNGAPTESFSIVGLKNASYTLLTSDNYISRTVNTYNNEDTSYINPLLTSKVFKLFKSKSENFNGLNNTSSISTVLYNDNKNPYQVTTSIKNGSAIVKTTNESLTFSPILSAPFIVDRPLSKTISTTIFPSSDVSSSEEVYEYDVNLLKKIQKRSTNSGETTPFITERNEYDVYGNIIQKKLSSVGLTDRISNFEYDSTTHRFLTKKTDIEGLVTEYTYNLSNGLLLSETLPSNAGYPLKTIFVYDKWGKKISTTDYLGNIENTFYYSTYNGIRIEKISMDGTTTNIIKDNLGRTIQEAKKSYNSNWSLKTTEYDVYDSPIKVSQPYFGTLGDVLSYTVWNEMSYDIYGRLIQTNTLKKSGSSGKVTTYSYSGLSVTENDGLKIKITTKDALNNIVSISESPEGTNVTYEYYANSNLKSTNSSGSITSILQDGWGRKKQLNDPSAGIYNYTYNNFGEVLSEEIVGKGLTTYNLDGNGKLLSKTIVGVGTDTTNTTTTNNYNTTSKLLESSVFSDATNNFTITNAFVYNNYKELIQTSEVRKNGTTNIFKFQKNIEYDVYGRPKREFLSALDYASGKKSEKWIKKEYNTNGYLSKIINDSDNVVLWNIDKLDASDRLLSAYLTDSRKVIKSYDEYGFPTQIKVDKLANPLVSGTLFTNLMTLNTQFDPIYGNLINRTSNLIGSWSENLTYDALDRLKNYKNSAGIQTQTYNGNGTISTNNIGEHAYTVSNKPYNVSSITPLFPSPVYDYYNTREQNINYNVFKSPVAITELTKEKIDFEYNSSNGRTAMYYGDMQPLKANRSYRKYYSADGLMEIKYKLSSPTSIDFVTYIGGDGYSAPLVLKSNGTTQQYLNLHRDYQGTIVAISSSTSVFLEKRTFDVWGSLIQYSNSSGVTTLPTTSTSMLLDRGYTGHEHLLGVGLINMNGRIYDDKLHKFLQPDNNIQEPYNTQNFNRYGYALNNPTKYTDPTGEFWEIVAFIFSAYVHGAQATGEANPFKWNAGQFANVAMGAGSIIVSNYVSREVDNYVQNYGSNQNVVSNNAITANNTIEDHSYALNSSNENNEIGDENPSYTVKNNLATSIGYVSGGVGVMMEQKYSSNMLKFYTSAEKGMFGVVYNGTPTYWSEGFKGGTRANISNDFVKAAQTEANYIKGISLTTKIVGYLGAISGYYSSLVALNNRHYDTAAVEGTSNSIGVALGAYVSNVAGLGWSIGWGLGGVLSNTEAYNYLLFGPNSETYYRRGMENGWYKSKILDE